MKRTKGKNRKKTSLNLIYYLDGGKTRTLSISFFRLKVLIFAFVFLIAWAAVASALLLKNHKAVNTLSTRLKTSLDMVFECEVKQNAVYETVYTTEKKSPKVQTPEKHAELKTALTEPAPPDVELKQKEETQKTSVPLSDLLKTKLQVRTEDKDLAVEIESPSLSKREDQIHFSVALRNKKNHLRAEGTLWAIAEWQNADGTKHIQYSPEQVPGHAKSDQATGNTFSIRQYKVKNFTFSIPNKNASLTKIDVWLSHRNSRKNKFEIFGNQSPSLR